MSQNLSQTPLRLGESVDSVSVSASGLGHGNMYTTSGQIWPISTSTLSFPLSAGWTSMPKVILEVT